MRPPILQRMHNSLVESPQKVPRLQEAAQLQQPPRHQSQTSGTQTPSRVNNSSPCSFVQSQRSALILLLPHQSIPTHNNNLQHLQPRKAFPNQIHRPPFLRALVHNQSRHPPPPPPLAPEFGPRSEINHLFPIQGIPRSPRSCFQEVSHRVHLLRQTQRHHLLQIRPFR